MGCVAFLFFRGGHYENIDNLDSAMADYRGGVRGGGSCISDAVGKVGAAV
jgi:hypothetical protein